MAKNVISCLDKFIVFNNNEIWHFEILANSIIQCHGTDTCTGAHIILHYHYSVYVHVNRSRTREHASNGIKSIMRTGQYADWGWMYELSFHLKFTLWKSETSVDLWMQLFVEGSTSSLTFNLQTPPHPGSFCQVHLPFIQTINGLTLWNYPRAADSKLTLLFIFNTFLIFIYIRVWMNFRAFYTFVYFNNKSNKSIK